MKLFFIGVFFALLFGLLCGPTVWVARRLQQRGDIAALGWLRVACPAQLITAAGLCLAADATGLTNPAGYTLAIVLAVSVLGAAVFGSWRGARMLLIAARSKRRC